MNSQTVQNWLKFGSIMIIGFGIILSLNAIPGTADTAILLADFIIWPLDGAQQLGTIETKLLCVILGAVLIGWGVVFWLLTTRLYEKEPELTGSIITWSISIWFIIDTSGSLLVGVPFNAMLNLTFLIVFILPLRMAKK